MGSSHVDVVGRSHFAITYIGAWSSAAQGRKSFEGAGASLELKTCFQYFYKIYF